METNVVFKSDRISDELLERLGNVNVGVLEKLKYEFVESKLEDYVSEGNSLNYASFLLTQYDNNTIVFKLSSMINGDLNELDIEILYSEADGLAFSYSGKDIFGVIKDPDVELFDEDEDYPYVTNIYELIKSKAEEFDLDLLIFKDESHLYPDIASTNLDTGELYRAFDWSS